MLDVARFSREEGWNDIGKFVGEKGILSKDAIQIAGLDWEARERPLYVSNNDHKEEDVFDNLEQIKKYKAIYKNADEQSLLGIVGHNYSSIQNIDAFEFMDTLIPEGSIRYHTAGEFRKGKHIWLLAKVGDFDVLPNDPVSKYLFLYNSHDGTTSLRCLFTTVRVVCENTAALALRQGRGQGISIRHSGDIMARLNDARKLLHIGEENFVEYQEMAQNLTKVKMSDRNFNEVAKSLFPDAAPNKVTNNTQKSRDKLIELWHTGVGQDLPGVAGTGWAAYNAIVEYSNYFKNVRGSNKASKRFEHLLTDASYSFIQDGLDYISEFAA